MDYPITPVPAPRQSRRDAWNPSPMVQRYRAFKDEVALHRVTLAPAVKLTFWMPMPKSWSKAKKGRMRWSPHTSRPDLDNLVKALLDAVYDEDAHVHHIDASKRWERTGAITITVLEG